MFWLIKKFGLLLSLTGMLLGLAFLPADYLELQTAINAWGKVFTVSNREILLITLGVILLVRLAYMDLNRSLNDSDWPPVRERLRRFLAVLFKRDARTAELAVLKDERKLARARSAEERLSSIRKHGLDRFARQLWAREIRQQEWFWSELKPPATPKTIVEMESQIAVHGKGYIDFRLSDQYRDMYKSNFSHDNGSGRIDRLVSQFNYPALQIRFNQIRRKWQQSEAERDLESASYFPYDESRNVWKEALKNYWAFCQVRDELSRAMHSTSMPEAMPISEEYLPQLPLDTEEETQR